MGRLAGIYRQQSKFAESEKLQAEAYAVLPKAVGPEHPSTLTAACNLAFCRHMLNRDGGAEELARPTRAIYDRKYPDDRQRFRCQALLGASLAGQSKFAEAEPLLVGGYQGMLDRKAKTQPDALVNRTYARRWIIDMYQGWGKPDKAREWRAEPQSERVQ